MSLKVTYEFDPIEDRIELEIFQAAQKTLRVLQEIDGALRVAYKYDDDAEAWKWREKLRQFATDEGLDLDGLGS